MPVKAVAELVGCDDARLWRVLHHYVGAARARLEMSAVTDVGVDETSAARGQDYISLFVDHKGAGGPDCSLRRAATPPPWGASPVTSGPTAATRMSSSTWHAT